MLDKMLAFVSWVFFILGIAMFSVTIFGGNALQNFYVNTFTEKPIYEMPTVVDSREVPILAGPNSVEGSSHRTDYGHAVNVLDSLGAQGMTVVFTEDERNCGVRISGQGGCYNSETPNLLYISLDLAQKPSEYVITHEFAHFLQFRDGLPYNECEADMYASSRTGSSEFSYYLNTYDCSEALTDYHTWD